MSLQAIEGARLASTTSSVEVVVLRAPPGSTPSREEAAGRLVDRVQGAVRGIRKGKTRVPRSASVLTAAARTYKYDDWEVSAKDVKEQQQPSGPVPSKGPAQPPPSPTKAGTKKPKAQNAPPPPGAGSKASGAPSSKASTTTAAEASSQPDVDEAPAAPPKKQTSAPSSVEDALAAAQAAVAAAQQKAGPSRSKKKKEEEDDAKGADNAAGAAGSATTGPPTGKLGTAVELVLLKPQSGDSHSTIKLLKATNQFTQQLAIGQHPFWVNEKDCPKNPVLARALEGVDAM